MGCYVFYLHFFLRFGWVWLLLVVLILFELEDHALESGHVDALNVQLLDMQVLAEKTDELFCVVAFL